MRTRALRHRPRTIATAGVAAVSLLAAACGDDSTSSSDDGLRPPVPVNVAGAASGGAGGATSAMADTEEAAGTDDRMTTDLSIAPWGGYAFEVGDGLGDLPTADVGYQFTPGPTLDEATVRRIAEALGVDADPVATADPTVDGSLWRVGPDDGSAPSITFGNDPQLSWYYNSAWLDAPAVEPCIVSDDGTTTCPEPEPPTGVPTSAEAEARARELLEAMGEDPDAMTYEVYADEWSASVTAYGTLGSLRSPMALGFGFGAEGVLQYANGYLAEPVQVGPYPLVDLDTALARLVDQSGPWRGGVFMDAAEGAGTDGATMAAEGEPATTVLEDGRPPATTSTTDGQGEPAAPVTEPLPVDEPVDLPVVDESVPPPAPETVVLTGVEADLWWVWDAEGSVWLLPAYRFTDDDGRAFVVPAVTDEFLVIDPASQGAGGVSEPGVVVTSEPPVTIEPVPATVGESGVDVASAGVVVGLPVDEATKVLEGSGLTLRVVRTDGEDLAVTADFVDTRVNVAVETRDGLEVVTEIVSVG